MEEAERQRRIAEEEAEKQRIAELYKPKLDYLLNKKASKITNAFKANSASSFFGSFVPSDNTFNIRTYYSYLDY